MCSATPRAAVEGANVVPDRSFRQGLAFHPCHEAGRCVGFALDVDTTHKLGSEVAQSELDAEVESADSCAERHAVDGT